VLEQLHSWGYHLVPWSRNPRKPLIKGWLEKGVDPAGFIRAYGEDLDWAVVPTFACVLDLEMKNGLDGVEDLRNLDPRALSYARRNPVTKTKSGGFHIWFRQPAEPLTGGHHIRPGVEAKAINGSVHIPPSAGYTEITPLCKPEDLPELPAVILDAWKATAKVPGQSKTYCVERYAMGERRARLCSMAGRLRAAGLTYPELNAALLAVRDARCEDPSTFTDAEIHGIAHDYSRRPERSEPDRSWFPAR